MSDDSVIKPMDALRACLSEGGPETVVQRAVYLAILRYVDNDTGASLSYGVALGKLAAAAAVKATATRTAIRDLAAQGWIAVLGYTLRADEEDGVTTLRLVPDAGTSTGAAYRFRVVTPYPLRQTDPSAKRTPPPGEGTPSAKRTPPLRQTDPSPPSGGPNLLSSATLCDQSANAPLAYEGQDEDVDLPDLPAYPANDDEWAAMSAAEEEERAAHLAQLDDAPPATARSGRPVAPATAPAQFTLMPTSGTAPPKGKAGKAAKKPSKMETGLPDGWGPAHGHYAYGGERGMDRGEVDRQAERFRQNSLAKGSLFVDWAAAFRTWLLRSQDFAARRPALPASAPGKSSVFDSKSSQVPLSTLPAAPPAPPPAAPRVLDGLPGLLGGRPRPPRPTTTTDNTTRQETA